MSDETISAIEQKFNGESYIFLKRTKYNDNDYSVFFKLDDPNTILVAKEVISNGIEGYEIITGDEYLEVMARINYENE